MLVWEKLVLIICHRIVKVYTLTTAHLSPRTPSALTFFLFSTFTLIANLDGTYRQDDGHDEEQYSADHSGRNGFMLNPCRHGELDLLTGFVALERVGQHPEVVGPATDQILHQVGRFLRPNLASVERFPLGIGAVFDRVELHQMGPFEWNLPRDEKPVRDLQHAYIPWLTRFWTW